MDWPLHEGYEDPSNDPEYFEHLAGEISAEVERNGGISQASKLLQNEIQGLLALDRKKK